MADIETIDTRNHEVNCLYSHKIFINRQKVDQILTALLLLPTYFFTT
jgi:hypothetical protein